MSPSSEAWKKVTLGEICEFRYGKSLPEAARAGGSIPVFGSNGQVGLHDEALTSGPTIIIGRKGSFGEVNFSQCACWPIDTTYYVDESATDADLRWLSYRLAALGLTSLNRAAAIPGLNREDAYRQHLLLPPLAEQRRITSILDHADALRAKRRAALAHLDALAQSIFLDMFGDPATNPKAWPVARLGDVVAINPRISAGAGTGERELSEMVSFVPMAAVSESKRRVSDYELRAIDEVAKGYTPFQRDDVLVAKITPCFENGKLCWVRDMPTAIGFGSTEFHVFRAPDPLVARFVFSLVGLPSVRERGARAMKGAAGQKRVPADFFADMMVPTPPASALEQFDRTCAVIDDLRAKSDRELEELSDLFVSLQHRAFMGDL